MEKCQSCVALSVYGRVYGPISAVSGVETEFHGCNNPSWAAGHMLDVEMDRERGSIRFRNASNGLDTHFDLSTTPTFMTTDDDSVWYLALYNFSGVEVTINVMNTP